MNLPSFINVSPALPATGQPAGLDYGRALSLREMARHYTELPKYLLAPEVAGLLHFVQDWGQHAFFNTLWNTGARLNEGLALRRRDFHLNESIPHVVLRTAKQRRAGGGRPRKGKSANRVVPLSDPAYVDEMRRLFASTKEQFEDDPITGERRAQPVWNVSDRTVRNWLVRATDAADRDGVRLSIDVSPHTFRHSFAMHLLYGHVHPKVLQGLLGHEKFESTEVYTKIFALDVAASQQLRFTLDARDALQLLRGNN
ncbi:MULTISPECIES: tyrosine-type recombinase/integrase [Enterobacteriaceae]|jgi:integrase|uniref:tyrosine-type recombinase/integrase n=1 Tax=Enterobacteriaceae TaxID=543 RepID=UPI000F83DCE5|nr:MULTISPECIES: tyrosine-type recombinase/integrase [Enterobacteriaceae]EBF8603505.1 phage integrase family protein [Salmonella enterica subsp. enterica serovar Larochelle]MBT1694752.1 tyrosine-type recombinase/integrase [Enterobacter hormaechei subsp. hoffmannii]MXG73993.1 tyrosine-type recombinase/integrase [Escherichia coli]HCB4577257.1 tyrosine-type recombinase/integrase [Salmonella enterica]EEA6701220.1 tyrosine-type recombinase/integrase [Salmonella enterica subsp. enterica serovar Laro